MEDTECTFQPNVGKPEDGDETRNRSGNKWEELYRQADSKQAIHKQDADLDLMEFQKNHEEYTFKPEIHEINYTGSVKPIVTGQLAQMAGKPAPRSARRHVEDNESENVRPTIEPGSGTKSKKSSRR